MEETKIDNIIIYILCKNKNKNGLNITKLGRVLKEVLDKNSITEKIGRPTVKSRLSVLTDRKILDKFSSGTSLIYKLSSEGENECKKLEGKFN